MSGLSSTPIPESERNIQLQNELAWAKMKILSLEAQLRLQRIKKYGPGSEKLDSAQLELLELEPGVSRLEVRAESQREPLPAARAKSRKHPGRQELPAELPRVERVIACTPEQRTCKACGQETAVIGYETSEQLPFREAALFEEAVQRGRRDGGRGLTGRQGEFAPQGGAGTMRVFAFEAFDEAGQLRGDGAGLATVLARFGSQRFEAAVAVAPGPIQQGIDGNRRAFRIGEVVVAGGNLLSAVREFAAGKSLDHQRRDHAITEEGEFFGFGIHGENLRPER
jgi:Transposase C of IS166 homeodomain